MNSKIIKGIMTVTMLVGAITTVGINSIDSLDAATDSTNAPDDWAFKESSIPLHDAILEKYPEIDQVPNGNGDGYISKSEATTWTGIEINLSSKGVTGTLDGLEFFKNSNLNVLNLHNNKLTGKIPEGVFSLVNLKNLTLSNNMLSGTIDTYNLSELTELKLLNLSHNNFSGDWPSFIGLERLEQLHLAANSFTVAINEVDFSPLVSLQILSLYRSQVYGEMPDSVYELPIKTFDVANNSNLTGNIATGFNSNNNNSLTYVSIQGTGMIQAKPDATTLPDSGFKYDNLSENLLNLDQTGPVDGLTQEDINRAQESANYWSEPEKSNWQTNIDLAQNILITQNGVEGLLNDTKTDVLDIVTQDTIDDARELVDSLPLGQFKTDLQEDIDLAQDFFDSRLVAQAIANSLFTDSTHVDINNTTNQKAIEDVLAVVNALPSGIFKNGLIAEVEKAQNMLDAKTVVEDLFIDDTHSDIKDITNQVGIDAARMIVDKLQSGQLKKNLTTEINTAQDMLNERNAENAVADLFNPKGIIKDTITQEDIDNAQNLVNKVTNDDKKEELQDKLSDAQKQLDQKNTAKDAVDNLFNDDKTNLATGVGQKEIDNAQKEVDKLPSGDLKNQLQKDINIAQDMLDKQTDAKDKTNDLFNPDGTIKDSVTQEDINDAKDAVNKLPDGALKEELQDMIKDAQEQFSKQEKPLITPPTNLKPSSTIDSTTNSTNVNTEDTTDLTGLYAMLGMSFLGLVVTIKRRKQTY